MVIAPNNEIILLNVPIEIDNKNQLTFANANAQFQYFRYITDQYAYDHCTYFRKDGYVVIDDCFDNLIKYNYCMYQNENFSTKWYYAFILKLEWLSPNSTKVYIKTDVFQTYQFDVDYYASFVEREHINVSEDVPGANLINEGLETGEFIENASTTIKGVNPIYVLAFAKDPYSTLGEGNPYSLSGGCFNGIPSGLFYFVGSWQRILKKIKSISEAGYPDDIVSIFTIPSCALFGIIQGLTIDDLDNPITNIGEWLNSSQDIYGLNATQRTITLASTPSSLNGYTPRNAKLKQYPFCYLGFTPSNGSQKIFRYEDFQNGTPVFKQMSEINPNPSMYLIPSDYKGSTGVNVSESVALNGYPNISYHTDYFSGWLAQNSNLINLSLDRGEFDYELGQWKTLFGGASAGLGGVSAGVQGNALGGLGAMASIGSTAIDYFAAPYNHEYDVKEQMLQIEKQSMLPNSASLGGSNATLLGYNYMNSDVFTRYTIKRQFAERIDLYFDMYGYLTNKLKLPNLNNRPNWNYVKTLGLNITQKSTANVPQEDLQEFKNIFNNGVTLWHNPATFLDYSQNNR